MSEIQTWIGTILIVGIMALALWLQPPAHRPVAAAPETPAARYPILP